MPRKNKFLNSLVMAFYEQILARIPYSLGVQMRTAHFRHRMKRYGRGVRIAYNVRVLCPENIELDDFCGVASGAVLDGRGGLSIGKYTMVGFDSAIITSTHNHRDSGIPYVLQGFYKGTVTIGSNVWIGARAVILPGVNIGDNSIIGANTVISENIPPNSVVRTPRTDIQVK